MPFQETITIINNSGKIISTVSPTLGATFRFTEQQHHLYPHRPPGTAYLTLLG